LHTDASRRVPFQVNPLRQFESASGFTNVNVGRTLPVWKSDEEVSWSRDLFDRLEKLLVILLPELAIASLPKV
jgi:hypothetical protein